MPREKELFRDNLERLDKAFPNQELLNKSQVAQYCKIERHTAVKMFNFQGSYISKAKLASALS